MELDDSQGRNHMGTKLPLSFVRGHQAIDNDPVGVERAERANLISAHQAAVILDIRGDARPARFSRPTAESALPISAPRSTIARLDARSDGFSAHSKACW